MEQHVPDGQTDRWTNKKHAHFLNLMEASFVRAMLDNNSRLDLIFPDSSESTLDLKSQGRNKKHGAGKSAADIGGTSTRMDGRRDGRTRRISLQRYDPSQDQLVPRLGDRNW